MIKSVCDGCINKNISKEICANNCEKLKKVQIHQTILNNSIIVRSLEDESEFSGNIDLSNIRSRS